MTRNCTVALLISLIAAAGVGAGCAGNESHEHEKDVKVALADVPPAVSRTIEEHRAGGTVNEVERTTEDGKTVYEAEIIGKDGKFDMVISEDGRLLKTERDEDDKDKDHDEDEDKDNGKHAMTSDVAIPTPIHDGVRFTSNITHPYFPISAVRYAEMREESEQVIREVLDQTRVVGGVECTVLAEKEYKSGELKEIAYNCFAQDAQGNVYYFGEDVDDYRDGKVVSHGGSWMVGRNAAEPCLFMPATLTIGLEFKPENSPPEAEEFDRVERTDATLMVPAGSYKDVLVIQEGDKPGKWKERKYYARGVGLISENGEANLVTVRGGAGGTGGAGAGAGR